jgi:hypothetical protein
VKASYLGQVAFNYPLVTFNWDKRIISTMPKCAHVHQDGKQCGAYAITGDRFCMAHTTNPKMAAKAQEARIRGGKGRNREDCVSSWDGRPIESISDVQEAMSMVLDAGMRGEISTARISALASVASVLTKAIEGGKMAQDLEDLKTALEAIK